MTLAGAPVATACKDEGGDGDCERHCGHDEYPPRHDAFSTTHDGSRSRPDELTDNPGADNDVRELPENLRKNRSPLSGQA